jgi:TolB protein
MSSLTTARLARYVVAVVATINWTLNDPSSAAAGLVYAALRDGVWRVYYQPAMETAPRQVGVDVRGDATSPALSADGRVVAFENGGSILTCPLGAAGECKRLRSPRGAMVRPAWHPVTRECAFAEYVTDGKEEGADLFITRHGLSEVAPLLTQTGVQDDPAFSRDGRLLAYTTVQSITLHQAGVQVVQQIWLADLVSGLARQLLPGSARDMNPAWAPSSRAIAFASDRSRDFEIWTVDVDGTGLRQLTSGPGIKTRPRWSPDGKSIMFTLAREGRLSLWIIDADGGNLRPFEPFGPNSGVQIQDADWR